MGTQNELKLVKLTKEEKALQKAEKKRAKQETWDKVSDKDKAKQKKYKKRIIQTSVVFVLALIVLALLATGTIDSTIGIWGLIGLCVVSTIISRRE